MQKHLLVFIFIILFYSANAQNNFTLLNRIALPGDGGWDYVAIDDANQHLFVSHGNEVNVVDITTGKPLAVIPNTKGVHGIAIANDLNEAFISNGKDSSVTVIDLKTFSLITKIYVTGKNPDAILFDNFSQRIFTFNGKGKNATVIDAATNKVIGTIDMGGKPEFAVSNHSGKIFVNIENMNEVVMIDAQSFTIEKRFSVNPGNEPSGLAMDIANNRLFSVCGNKTLVITDALTGKLIANLPIGDDADAVVYDDATHNIYSSNGEGTLTVIHQNNANSYNVVETIPTQKGAKTLALCKSNRHLYLPTAEYDEVMENGKKHKKMKPNSFVILEMGE